MIAEQELIAAVLEQPSVAWECPVEPQHFSSEALGAIWKKVQELSRDPEPFDAVTVAEDLGGKLGERVLEIAGHTYGAPAAAPGYARRIVESWRKRKTADLCALGQSGEIDRDELIRSLMDLAQDTGRHDYSIAEALRLAVDDMEAAAEAGGGLRGISSGLADLDRILGGFQAGDLYILGARPSMGKTALMLHFAQSATEPAGVFTTEQPALQIAQRHAASIGGVPLSNLRQGRVGKKEVQAFAAASHKLDEGYRLFDQSSPSIRDIERKARQWRHRYGTGIIFVDYVQRIRAPGDKKHEQVGEVCRSLKTLARDLEIPVVALSQVNREVERRPNKRPGMADLSDSSEIEKEADVVMTLYRDEVYDAETRDKGVAEIRLVKNRHGEVGTVYAGWNGPFVRFGDQVSEYAYA